MKILVTIHEFPPIGGGGGHAAYDICKELVKRGHQVTVLTAYMQGLQYQETIDGIEIIRIASLRKESFRASFITMFAYIISGVWVGLPHIFKNRPDVIHSHFAVPSGALAWILSVLTNTAYILTIHLGDVPGGVPDKTNAWFRWVKPFTYPIWYKAKKIIAVSQYTRSLALKHYSVNIEVVPNGVELKRLAPTKISLNQVPHIVFAGRFVPQKNLFVILRVLSQLKEYSWTCSLLGDGFLFEDIKKEIHSLNLQDRIELTGWVAPGYILKQFDNSDILFMPSLSEGLPVVGVQALAKGLALVVSDIGGFADLVTHGQNGFLVSPNNLKHFCYSLEKLIAEKETLVKFRQASFEKAKQFDIEFVATCYEQFLKLGDYTR